jgi:hypothetical protein
MRLLVSSVLALLAFPAFAGTTPIADLRAGTTATISGTVEAITDEDEFRLADASGTVIVYIGAGIVPFDTGEQLTVNGIVDRELGLLELYARTATRADGSVVTFDHSDN